jgi:hypothetical protein
VKRRLLSLLGLGLGIAWLVSLGHGVPGPPVASPGRLLAWWQAEGPLLGAFALIRVLALAAAAYVAVLALLGLSAEWTRWHAARRLLERLSLPGARWFVRGALGLGMLAVAQPATALAAGPARGGSGAPAPSATVAPAAPPMLHRVAPTPPPTAAPVAIAPRSAAPPTGPVSPDAAVLVTPASASVPSSWTLRPGDSLWSVSKAVLRQAWGRPVSDHDVGPFWARVVEANRPRLPHPADPDLVFPDTVVVVPTPPPPA